MTDTLIIALTKGRILKESLPLLAMAGIRPLDDIVNSRKLVFDTSDKHVRLLVLRGLDVPVYVQHGTADMGVVGKDMLLEYGGDLFYEPLDLKIACCRLMTAGLVGQPAPQRRIKVATKFVNVAKRYYAERGIQADIIKLYGAMELAPVMGLADQIVDIVDTGNTLRANGLEPLETITTVSSRLVVNKAAAKIKHQRIQMIVDRLAEAVKKTGAASETADGQ